MGKSSIDKFGELQVKLPSLLFAGRITIILPIAEVLNITISSPFQFLRLRFSSSSWRKYQRLLLIEMLF